MSFANFVSVFLHNCTSAVHAKTLFFSIMTVLRILLPCRTDLSASECFVTKPHNSASKYGPQYIFYFKFCRFIFLTPLLLFLAAILKSFCIFYLIQLYFSTIQCITDSGITDSGITDGSITDGGTPHCAPKTTDYSERIKEFDLRGRSTKKSICIIVEVFE